MSSTSVVPTCAACAAIWSMSHGPWTAVAKPGKFSTSVVMESWPPGCMPRTSIGERLARAA